MKHLRKIALAMSMSMGVSLFSGCLSFEERCVTTEEGFVYYEDKNIGLCLIEIPDVEELIIPEYIDGKRVEQLGYQAEGIGYLEDFSLDGTSVKKLTIQHKIDYFSVAFPNIETLIYNDILNIFIEVQQENILIGNWVGVSYVGAEHKANVELRDSDRVIDVSRMVVKNISIPTYVTIIEAGVFDRLEGVTIRTVYESQPEGWEEGWNGSCIVEWGVEL